MAELNNEEIRSTLQDLISSPDFNVNDPDTKKQLNNILDQINVYSYLNHNKNYSGIRCLSKEEYDRYLINGTCDGSIIANNINVWHYDNNRSAKSHLLYSFGEDRNYNWSYQKMAQVSSEVSQLYCYNDVNNIIAVFENSRHNNPFPSRTYTYNYNVDILINNASNKFYMKNAITLDCIALYFNQQTNKVQLSGGRKTIYIPFDLNKNFTKNNYSVTSTFSDGGWNKLTVTLNANLNTCFRPVFFYIDNNKSKNIYY